MGCGASKKNEGDDETQTREVVVKPEDEDAAEQHPPPQFKIPPSLKNTIRGGSSIQPTVKLSKSQLKAIEDRKKKEEEEEKRRNPKKKVAAVATGVKAANRMTKAAEEKQEFLGVSPGGGRSATPKSPRRASGNPLAGSTDSQVTSPLASSPQQSSSSFTSQPSFTESDFEGFTTFKMLGKGAFGSTFECGLKSRKIVAVKIIEFGDITAGSEEMQNLRNEISLMKKFNHPNIVQYYGFTEDTAKKQMNIFMEYVTGGTLNSYMGKFEGAGVPIETCKDWTRQMIEGVGYLHEQGVVHRDIKGANVLMTLNGEVKLADFGCSKSIDDSVSKTRGCQTMVGTPYWMAPEVLKCEPYGTKSDVWSIGCTIVEMLTGKPAWPETENMWAAVYKIANSKGLPPNIPKNLPKQMMNFLEKVFERSPAKRASCKELLAHPWLKTN